MTNSELKQKLEQAQELLADVYHWASTPMSMVYRYYHCPLIRRLNL
jgi:hypothetical protein